jgi:hypothetical protein
VKGKDMGTDSMLDALQARGPHPDLAEDLKLFGQFVGAWDVDVTNIAADGTKQELKGEWHFGWALEGRAVMDVWITPRRSLRGQADPLEGSFAQGCLTRWIFSQITATSFHWRNIESSDDGVTWRTVQEMVAQRTHP